MKKLFIAAILALLATSVFADIKIETLTNRGDFTYNLEKALSRIPKAPEGYHLVGVETVLAPTSNKYEVELTRIFYYSDDPDCHSFALSSSCTPAPLP